MSIVISYLSLNTGSAECEAKIAVAIVRSNFFLISNLQGVGFADASGKPITIPEPVNRPADLTYFTFHSVVSAVAVDARFPDKTLSIKFSLRLLFIFPHSLDFQSPQTIYPVPRQLLVFSSVTLLMKCWMRSSWMIYVFLSSKLASAFSPNLPSNV